MEPSSSVELQLRSSQGSYEGEVPLLPLRAKSVAAATSATHGSWSAKLPSSLKSPYCTGHVEAETSPVSLPRCLFRIWNLIKPRSALSKEAFLLWVFVFLTAASGLIGGLYVPLRIVQPLTAMLKEPSLEFGVQYEFFAWAILCFLFESILQGLANLISMFVMIRSREKVVRHLHDLYLSPAGRSYYVMNNLDNRIDNTDQRISNDVDLMMQFLFEFFFGGILAVNSGMLINVIKFVAYCAAIFEIVEKMDETKGGGLKGSLACLGFLAVLQPVSRCLSVLTVKLQERQQHEESLLRVAHTQARTFSESICFYGGHATEHAILTRRFDAAIENLVRFALCRIPFDILQTFLHFSAQSVALTAAAWLLDGLGYDETGCKKREQLFTPIKIALVQMIMCLTMISKQVLDLSKGHAYASRVVRLIDLMEFFNELAGGSSEELASSISSGPRLSCNSVVHQQVATDIEFSHCNIYTPDGARLLIRDFSFSLRAGQSCLIMGPSGIGKSSILRVLGNLWPLFHHPSCEASFARPGPRNVFFLAQRPYTFDGTLREQIAYPIWDERLIDGLDDDQVERLFNECSLQDVWQARKHQLDLPGMSWSEVLSLGEQQRLQFGRLFWHHQWSSMFGDSSQGFFAILDESSASMDTESEMAVYGACKEHGFGFLSVAHRPTVIQFHSQVLLFTVDSDKKLSYKLKDGRACAHEAAAQVSSLLRRDSDEPSRCSPDDQGHESQGALIGSSVQSPETATSGISSYIQGTGSGKRGTRQGPADIVSPYGSAPEDDLANPGGAFRMVFRLAWLCHPPLCSFGQCFFFLHFVCLLTGAGFNGYWPRLCDYFFVSMQAGAMMQGAIVLMATNGFESIVRAILNWSSMRLMTVWRVSLVQKMHAAYMSPDGRNYYVLNNLDKRLDNADQRITNDVDLLMQFFFDYFFGGIIKVDSGAAYFMLSFLVGCYFMSKQVWEKHGDDGYWMAVPIASLAYFLATLPITFMLSARVSSVQEEQQLLEAKFRVAHTKLRTYSETVCFYGGEATEARALQDSFKPVCDNFYAFARRKFPLDAFELMIFVLVEGYALMVAALLSLTVETGVRVQFFTVLTLGLKQQTQCLSKLTMVILSFSKAMAFNKRVLKMVEVMEEFETLEARVKGKDHSCVHKWCCSGLTHRIRELPVGDLVPEESGAGIVFSHCNIYTPDGSWLLMKDFSLTLKPGQSCLIMGNSGIGKSSLLRVMGRLWPLFRSPMDILEMARFVRPGPRNMFFLAQRPYIFEGTLREQIAYPVWNEWLRTSLRDHDIERLFREANLADVWEARQHQLDDPNVVWTDVLSLGEQQRLQFCRLFWHHEWHKAFGDQSQGFFAVLDESSASMDMESELEVYRACQQRGFGYLSVAHRPTVIQFHTTVVQFHFDEDHRLQVKEHGGAEMACSVAEQMIHALPNKLQS